MFSQEQWDQLLTSFLEEARELIQSAESALLALDEQEADEDTIHGLFRSMHTLKGSAGLFSLDAFVHFAHEMENLIMRVRDGEFSLTPDMISSLLKALDVLSLALNGLEENGELPAIDQDNPELLATLRAFTKTKESVPVPIKEAEVDVERDQPPTASLADWHISLRFDHQILQFGFDPASFIRYLTRLGQLHDVHLIHSDMPSWPDFQAEQCYLGIELGLQTNASKTDIESVFEFIQDLSQIRIFPPESKVDDYLQLIESLPNEQDRLGEILISSGLITEKELARGLKKQHEKTETSLIGDVLVQEGSVPPAAVDAALKKQNQIREQKQQDSA